MLDVLRTEATLMCFCVMFCVKYMLFCCWLPNYIEMDTDNVETEAQSYF